MTQANVGHHLQTLVTHAAEDRRRRQFALNLYRPTDKQLAFHEDNAGERIVRGGHRSGKSTCGALETAHAATRMPIFTEDGREVEYKYPTRPLRIWIIGKDEKHLGETIHTLLFTGGLFYVIDDLETGLPRIWNPNRPEDVERKSQRRTSGPMIPPEMIEKLSYSDRSINAPSRCELKNGTVISFYPSGGNCPSGVPVDLIWIDEDIVRPEYVADWQGRLIDRAGRLIWTAFPWASNDALTNLCDRAQAEREAGNEDADIKEFRLSMSDNPYLDPDEKRKVRDRWAAAGDMVLAARDRGEFPTDAVLMYPEFSRRVHGIDRDRYLPDCQAASIMRECDGEPPDDWTRLLALDPGSRKAAVLFMTIPTPDIGDEWIIYDEIFQTNSDARRLAKEILKRTKGRSFQNFIIDAHAARITPTGFGKTVRQVYEEAFIEHDVRTENGDHSFMDGNDNVHWRCERVRQELRFGEQAKAPRLLFWLPNMYRTIEEFGRYKRRISQQDYTDDPIAVNNDCMNCLEYLVGSGPKYTTPKRERREPEVMRQFRRITALFNRGQGPGGPSVSFHSGG